MARGFATGLFHGALAGAVGLGALSLLMPAPNMGNDALVPDAGVIGTPAGSEFGRGEDAQPLLPAPLTRPAPAPLGGAASVDAPLDGADATLTGASTVTADRPETRAEDPLAPPEIAPVTVDADIPTAPTAEIRTSPAAPERFESPAPDIEPLPMVLSEPQDRGVDQPATTMPPSIADLPVVRPGLPPPPAAESPADMSALTRGRPEDGLGAGQATPEDTPIDSMPASPDAVLPNPLAPRDAPASVPEPEAQPVAPEDFVDQRAAAAEPTPDAAPPAQNAPTQSEAGQAEGAADMQPNQPAAVPATDASETAPVEPLAVVDAPAELPASSPSRADPGRRDYPAINLSTPPDIGGLLRGQ